MLPLACEFGSNDAFVERPTLGVVTSVTFVKRMSMRQQRELHAPICIGQQLDLESANLRLMDTKLVA